MGRFDISPEVAEEYRGKFRGTAADAIGEEVLAAGPFRPTGAGTKYGISKLQVGALAYGAAHMAGKKKAGGLPGQFLLAVTPSKLYALKYKSKRSGPEAKEVVAEWDRKGIKVETERLKTTTVRAKGARIEHRYEVSRGDELLATGQTTVACINRGGRVSRLPEWLLTS